MNSNFDFMSEKSIIQISTMKLDFGVKFLLRILDGVVGELWVVSYGLLNIMCKTPPCNLPWEGIARGRRFCLSLVTC